MKSLNQIDSLTLAIPKVSPLHIIAGSIFLTLAFITLRTFLAGESLFNYRDLIWPSSLDSVISSIWYTFDLEGPRRSVYLGPFLAVFNFLGLSALDAQKLLFLFFRFFTGFFAYIAVSKFLSFKFNDGNKGTIFVVSIFAGFFYSFNPIAASMISTTLGFAFAYCITPLAFYFFDKTLHNRNFKNILITSGLITLALAGTTQFLVLLPLLILIPWLGILLFEKGRSSIGSILKSFASVMCLVFLLSFYWILPSLATMGEGITLKPPYVLTEQALALFSQQNTFFNIFRLMGDWWPRVPLEPIINDHLWMILTFSIPIAAVSSLLVRNSKLAFYISGLSLISMLLIFLHKGSQPPFPDFYISLFDIPIIGWMFRVPSKIAMMLSFVITMIIALGFYGLFTSKHRRIDMKMKYATLLIFTISTSLISWPLFTGDFGGIYKDDNKFQELTTSTETSVASLSSNNIVMFGPHSRISSIQSIESLNINNSSIIPADYSLHNLQLSKLRAIDGLFITDREHFLMQFLPHDAIIVEPFRATKTHNPGIEWSKAGTHDPLHAPFHNYLEQRFDIDNSDSDYDRGLVFTWARDTLDIPVNVKNSGTYEIYLRSLKTTHGGAINVYLDSKIIGTIETKDQLNVFVWESIGTHSITEGKHIVSLENVDGLNAVNILVLIPEDKVNDMIDLAEITAYRTMNIYLLEAESDLYIDGQQTRSQNGDILTLEKGVQISRDLDVIKTSNYTVAINAKVCEDCSSLWLKAGDMIHEISLTNNNTEMRWVYLTTFLRSGTTNLIIWSEGTTEIDKVILYSDSQQNTTISNLFYPRTAAQMVAFTKIDQTKYQLEIDSSGPFILKFEEPYSPLWRAYIGQIEYRPVQLHDNTIAFIVNEAGKLNILIEYKPQSFFYYGLVVSIMTLAASLYYVVKKGKDRLPYNSAVTRPNARRKEMDRLIQIVLQRLQIILSIIRNQLVFASNSRVRSFLIDPSIPTLLITIALILLVAAPFVHIQGKTFAVDQLMLLIYGVLVIGVTWQFIHIVLSRDKKGITEKQLSED